MIRAICPAVRSPFILGWALVTLLGRPGVANAQHAPAPASRVSSIEWPAYGGDAGGSKYSAAAQITRDNVRLLRVAWTYRTGDYTVGPAAARFENTPLFVDGTLIVATPLGSVIAMDPVTARERWRYEARVDLAGDYGDFATRGVSLWRDRARTASTECSRRLFLATIDARLIALDASSGRLCRSFGDSGVVDLAAGLFNPPRWRGEYQVTSPPAIIGDLVVVGSAIADNQRANAPSGIVRAYDARTGRERWRWDPVPRLPGQPGHDSWRRSGSDTLASDTVRTGAANAWSIISVDTARDLVFIPIGSASPDFFGGERLGQNLYANSVVALRGSTGAMVWHFQAVHHDIWDYDVPAQPALFMLRRDGVEIPALAQTTKMGHLFILHRETGAPLFPVEERSVPTTAVAGETPWPTQPFPIVPAPLVPARLTPDDAFGVTSEEREACRARLRTLRSEGIFTPPSLEGTVIFPGNVGGSYWGGVAIDPVRRVLVTPTNRLAMVVTLIPRADLADARRRNRGVEIAAQSGTPYGVKREVLWSARGVPCNPPPWGALTAIDLRTGAVRWEAPLGTLPVVAGVSGAERWGSPNLGGVLLTGGGLAFAAGALDQRVHAYDVETGAELWSAPLPAGGNAAPMSFQSDVDGRQYIVIAAGGHNRLGTKLGDHVVAFALPRAGPARKQPSSSGARTVLARAYVGELRIERTRYPATIRLSRTQGQIVGELRISEPAITGTLSGTRSGDTLRLTMPFRYPAKSCSGTMEGIGELANGGRLLVGELRVVSSCSQAPEQGTFAVRPRP